MPTLTLLLAACRSDLDAQQPHSRRSPPPAPPNVVLVVVDDLGWTALSSDLPSEGIGSDFHQTPAFDALADESVVFTRFWAAPNCAPTRAGLMSGLHPARTGVYTTTEGDHGTGLAQRPLDAPPWTPTLPPETVTVAEALRAAGYRTAHLGKWHLGDPDLGAGPEDQGFDLNVGGTAEGHVTGGSSGHFAWEDGRFDLPGLGPDGQPHAFMADRLTDEAIAVLSTDLDVPAFVHLAHFTMHTPIAAPPADLAVFADRTSGERHDDPVLAAMLLNLDRNLDRLLEHLRTTEDPRSPGATLDQNTLLVVVGDNGGQGGYADLGAGSDHRFEVIGNAPLRGGKGMLTEGGLRTLLLARWPAGGVAPAVVRRPAQHLDVYPTLLDAAGLVTPSVDGTSLLPTLRGTASPPLHEVSYWHFPVYVDTKIRGVYRSKPATVARSGSWKLWHLYETATWQLYDLEADPAEQDDLAAVHPEIVRDLGGSMRSWLVETDAALPVDRATGRPVPLPDPGA